MEEGPARAGTTVVAATLALVLARSAPGGVLLTDLSGDLPTALGLPEPGRSAGADPTQAAV